jgi:hypothetical protein
MLTSLGSVQATVVAIVDSEGTLTLFSVEAAARPELRNASRG